MHRLASIVLLVILPACASLAELSDFRPVDCSGPSCIDADVDAADASVEVDASDAAIESAAPPDTSGCTPLGSKSVTIGSWSIDATEVTNAQYAAFVAARKAVASEQPPQCAWNTSYVPTAGWPAPDAQCNHPVTRIDWCDAYMYCRWAGKRLCGSPSGGQTQFSDSVFATASGSQWFAACSRNVSSRFSYGSTYMTGWCVDDAYLPTDVKQAVGSATRCHGDAPPYDALFDLTGNVAEWEDSCSENKDGSDDCRVRGGSYKEAWDHCECNEPKIFKRGQTADDVGFRCCSP